MPALPSLTRSSSARPGTSPAWRSRLAHLTARLGTVLPLVVSGLVLTAAPAQAAPGDVAILAPGSAEIVHVPSGGTSAITIGGTGEPGETILAYVQDNASTVVWGPTSVTVDGGGAWSVTTTQLPAIAAGTWYFAMAQVVGYPTTNSDSAAFSIRGDAVAVGISNPANGATVTMPVGATDVSLHVSGVGTPGETVTVTSGAQTETETVQGGGTWTTAPLTFGVGTHTVTASQSASPASTASVTFTVVKSPDDVRISSPATGTTITLPATTLVVSGTGVPGHQIAVRVDTIGLQTVTVDADGDWSASFTITTPDRYDIQALDLVNNSRALSTVVVRSVDTGTGSGPGAGTGAGGAGELAATGAEAGVLAVGGALLVGAGAAVLLLRRRRLAVN